MKILFNSLSKSLGGVETFVFAFVKWLRARDVEVGFLTSISDMYYSNELKEIGCNIHTVNCNRRKNPIKYKSEIKRFFDNTDYDVFYYNTCSASFIEHVRQAKKHGLTCVVHSHSAWKGKGIAPVLHKLNKRKLSKIADIAFACSDLAGEWLFDAKYAKYEFIQNGIDLRKYAYSEQNRLTIRKKYNIPEKSKVIGHVGSLSYIKNQKFILDIAHKLIDDGYDITVMLVGDGNDREMLNSYVTGLSISDNVVFTGNQKNINEVLSAFDVFVFPSLFEGLPISVIEAQANGLPIIISDTVSELTRVASNVTNLSLKECVDVWSGELVANLNAERQDNIEVLRRAGFDCNEVYNRIFETIVRKSND